MAQFADVPQSAIAIIYRGKINPSSPREDSASFSDVRAARLKGSVGANQNISKKRGDLVRKAALVSLVIGSLAPVLGHAAYICTDESGRTSVQDRPCPEKKASTTNVPLKAGELSDSNSIETVNRFYKAMSERDPTAASRFLADTFASEVKLQDGRTVHDDKTSMTAGLHQVLSAAKTYSAKTNCRVLTRTAQAYSLSCHVDEQGIVMNQTHRTVANQAVTIVLDEGLVKIGKIVSEERE